MKSSDSRAFSNPACLQGPSWRRVSPSLPPDRQTDRTDRSTDTSTGWVAITDGRAGRQEEVPGRGPLGPSSGQVSLTWERPSCSSLRPRASTSGSEWLALKSDPPGPVWPHLPAPRLQRSAEGWGTLRVLQREAAHRDLLQSRLASGSWPCRGLSRGGEERGPRARRPMAWPRG